MPVETASSTSGSVDAESSINTQTRFRLRCQWLHSEGNTCSKESEWVAVFSCCEFTLLLCNPHQVGGEVAMSTGNTVHTRCRQEIEQMQWVAM